MTVTRWGGAKRRNSDTKRIVWTEIVVVVFVIAVLFTFMLPQFLKAQSSRKVESVKESVHSLAKLLAETPGIFAEIDRGYVDFPTYNTHGGFDRFNITSTLKRMVPFEGDEHRLIQPFRFQTIDYERFSVHYPSLKAPEFDGEVNFFLVFYPEYFAAGAWFGEMPMMSGEWSSIAQPNVRISEEGYVEPQFDITPFDLSNGLDSQGGYIVTSYDLGWRIRPSFLRDKPGGREPIQWEDWTRARNAQTKPEESSN